ncbi:uncharacterized protein LOC141641506 [Silene latifolia]|uniref:uncharacterized protein LOC141641506 n=1 Tax=Silene latifolia TaxID=37657 RepID=UPI003D770D1D
MIPKGVLRRIDTLCRNYLWDSSLNFEVSSGQWEKLSVPKAKEDWVLETVIIGMHFFVGKLVWWIHSKPGALWVRWVNHIYMKGTPWASYSPKPDVAWSWRSICKLKAKFPLVFSTGIWSTTPPGYSVSSGYELIRTHYPRVPWSKYTWNVWSVPKHTFINWLIVREALRLKDKLFLLGISQDALCLVCGLADETHLHLFYQCHFIRRIMGMLSAKLHVILPLTGTLAWVHSKPWSQIKKKVTIAWIQAAYYMVWIQRNKVFVDGTLAHPNRVVHDIVSMMKIRCTFWLQNVMSTRDKEWIVMISS